MFTFPTVKRLWANPWAFTACTAALLAALFTSLQLLDGLFVQAPAPTFSLFAELKGLQDATATLEGSVRLNPIVTYPSAGTLLQTALISFGVLAAIFFTASTVEGYDKPSIRRGAGKMTLGVMLLFLPVAIEWFAAIYIKPPIPWNAPWLISSIVGVYCAFLASLWVAATFMFSGFFDGFDALWKCVMGKETPQV